MNDSERTLFQRERDARINNIAQVFAFRLLNLNLQDLIKLTPVGIPFPQGLEQVIANMQLLNRNHDTIIAVGKDFENVASLWKNFTGAVVSEVDVERPKQESGQ